MPGFRYAQFCGDLIICGPLIFIFFYFQPFLYRINITVVCSMIKKNENSD